MIKLSSINVLIVLITNKAHKILVKSFLTTELYSTEEYITPAEG